MDITQRSKSFKALATAQPIRKEIQQTLNKLQVQKRRFLACERQQTLLKEQADRKRKELNQLKAQVPNTQTDEKRASQTNLKFRNADRSYQVTINNIQKLKDSINIHRRQVNKYKGINQSLTQQSDRLNKQIQKFLADIETKQNQNEDLKNQIINFREMNIKNLDEFRKSHINMNRSNVKEQNQRRRQAVSTRTFLGEQLRQSKMVHFQIVSQQLRKSGIKTNEGKVDIMSDSVPLAKARVNFMIHKNKQKIKIAEDYKKFGEDLQNLFEIMKTYKGRDDIDYLSHEFVAKEKQIQKLGQYIGKLQYRIVQSEKVVEKKQKQDNKLRSQLTAETQNQADKQYRQLNKHVQQDIQNLKKQNVSMNMWLKKVGNVLCPIAKDDDFSRNNASNVIGKIQDKLQINRATGQRKSSSPTKQYPTINIDHQQHMHRHGDFISYDKMKEYAEEYIKQKKGG